MDDAFSVPIGLNEETITEMLLLRLARQFAGRGIEVKSFTKHEEGTAYLGGGPTGADWEWRFEGPSGWGKTVRIQAKRLYMRNGTYGALDGAGTQLQDLVLNSGSTIPLYVLYNGPAVALLLRGRAAFPFLDPAGRKFCHWPYYDFETWGCSVAAVHHVPAIRTPAPHQFAQMEPWHTIVCDCSASAPSDLGRVVAQSLKRLYASSESGDGHFEYNFEVDDRRPPWATALLSPSEIALELPEGVRGVALIRQAEEPVSI